MTPSFALAAMALMVPLPGGQDGGGTTPRHPTGMAGANGRCTLLTMAGKPMACGDALISVRYSDGRRSIAVKAGDGLISFFGQPDAKGIAVTMVTGVRSTGNPDQPGAASQAAQGRCNAATIAANATITCEATTADGDRFAMSFVTDGKPPLDKAFE